MLTDREKFIILIDHEPLVKVDAIILLEGDGKSRIKKACELYKNKWAKSIVFSGGIKNLLNGSFPFEMVSDEFKANNVSLENIILEIKSQNTREQAQEIVKMCVSNNWFKVILVATHYHQYRAFLTFLKVLQEVNLERKIQIYNQPENSISWFKDELWGRRFELLENEFLKIEKYKEFGHLASFDDAISYQKWKEEQS